MSKDAKKTRTPRLRFPEFREAGAWEEKRLGDICEITNGKSNAQDHIEGGMYPLFDRSEVIKSSNEYIFDCETVIIPGEGMRFVPKYYNGKFDLHQRAYALLNFSGSGLFVYFMITAKSRLLASKAVQSTVLSLRLPILQNFSIQVPKHKPEQQKIAATLTSLDDLIAAQSDRISALQAHKKGLMQRLFPAEGETVPRLRFREFEGDGEWVEKTLGQIGDVLMCKRIFAEETNANGGVPFFKIGTLGGKPDAFIAKELFDDYKSKYNYPRKGEILITCSGTVGKCLTYNGEEAYYQDSNIVWIDNSSLEIMNELLYYILTNVNWGKLNSTTITRIYGSDLRNLKIVFPNDPAEQQIIATLLTSLDDLITAQSEKLEALKKHKKGLMQGVFPGAGET